MQYTYTLDDGGSTGSNACDTLYVCSYTDNDALGLPLAGRFFASNAYHYGFQGQFAEKYEIMGINNFELCYWKSRLCRRIE